MFQNRGVILYYLLSSITSIKENSAFSGLHRVLMLSQLEYLLVMYCSVNKFKKNMGLGYFGHFLFSFVMKMENKLITKYINMYIEKCQFKI